MLCIKYKIRSFVILFYCCLNIVLLPISSQTLPDRYDLDFKEAESNGQWAWLQESHSCKFLIDESEVIEGKHPVKIYFHSKMDYITRIPSNMQFVLHRIIILPKHEKNSTCNIIINNKTQNAQNVTFTANAINRDFESIVKKTVVLNSDTWGKNKISIKLLQAEAIEITISYQGNQSAEQNIWLDRLKIDIDGLDIVESKASNLSQKKTKLISPLSEKYIIQLSPLDTVNLLSPIKELKDKKIIGLGEFSHGSLNTKKVFQQIAKNLVINYNCKIIALELPLDMGLMYDLYVQGDTSIYLKNDISNMAQTVIDDYKETLNFLEWLREFNSHTTDKIHLAGINVDDQLNLYLFDYFYVVLGKEKGKPYLNDFYDKNGSYNPQFSEMLEKAKNDINLKNKIGKSCYNYLIYSLNSASQFILKTQDSTIPSNNKKLFLGSQTLRDSIMSERVKAASDIFLKKNEKLLVFAHNGHISKDESFFYPENKLRMGYYLNKKFGNSYFNISIQSGTGCYKIEDTYFLGHFINDTLSTPPLDSFEFSALKTHKEYFYYSSKYLPDDIIELESIPSGGKFLDHFKLTNLKINFDGYIFVRESIPLLNIDKSLHFKSFGSSKIFENYSILKSINYQFNKDSQSLKH
jgi:erythromycin esterase-like protein